MTLSEKSSCERQVGFTAEKSPPKVFTQPQRNYMQQERSQKPCFCTQPDQHAITDSF